MGLAIGDALGQATRGLRPEAVRQLYKRMDRFQDVRPFIGRGVKTYRMQGLYGGQTQMALALGESLILKKGLDESAFGDLLVQMSQAGPEGYFGVFRRPEGVFARSVQDFPNRMNPAQADWNTTFGSFFPLGVTTALFYGRDSATFQSTVARCAGMMNAHPWEISATAVSGFITLALVRMKVETGESVLSGAKSLIEESARWAEAIEQKCLELEDAPGASNAVSKTLAGLAERIESSSGAELSAWILENANGYLRQPLSHTTQGQTLTLLPQALVQVLVLPHSFDETIARTAMMGREANKLCALTGAWAGALFGLESMGEVFQAGLVNLKEVTARGQALLRRRFSGKGKDLIEMEMGLTRKEAEENRKHIPKAPKKSGVDPSDLKHPMFDPLGEEWEHDPLVEIRDNPRLRREFERDKSKKKKERRQRFE